ncbi:MAG: flagellar motor switch protein FliG [Chloroflexota bacterium]|jgi:flagellar motor switch protein FliG
MPPLQARKLNGRQKAAALMIALGADLSAEVMKHLKEPDIDRVTVEIFSMERIAHEVRFDIMSEALELAQAQGYISSGGVEYAKEVLSHALGPQRAKEIVERLASGWRSDPFDFVRMADPVQLVGFIQDERPQTIALVLSHLQPTLAASIIARLDRDLQAEVALRIATMERTTPEAIDQVEQTLKKRLSSVLSQDYSSVGGVEFLVKVLTQVNRSTEKTIMQSLEETDPALAEEVRKQMFVFEDIIKLDDRSIQRVLREIDTKDLALALKGASEEVKNRIFKNMSTRAAQILREDMEVGGPVRLRTVEDAQQRIVTIIRRLDDAEEIVIARGGAEDEVVA